MRKEVRSVVFGYIKPYVPFLTVAEHEAYKAVYCGLCREMGRVTGQMSRMTLSYDFAFLAFLRMAIEKTPTTFRKKGCVAHPFKKKTFAESNVVLTYCAGATAILAAAKTKDNIDDEKGAKRLAARIVYPFEKRNTVKLDGCLLSLAEGTAQHLSRLAELEKKRTPSIDAPSDIFGALLGDICAFGYTGAEERIAREIGTRVGKIIYVLDAADDIAEDIKGEKYNPIALVYESPVVEVPDPKSPEKIIKRPDPKVAEALMTAIKLELSRTKAAFSLLDTEDCPIYANIISNILDFGIPEETERIFNGRGRTQSPLKYGA